MRAPRNKHIIPSPRLDPSDLKLNVISIESALRASRLSTYSGPSAVPLGESFRQSEGSREWVVECYNNVRQQRDKFQVEKWLDWISRHIIPLPLILFREVTLEQVWLVLTGVQYVDRLSRGLMQRGMQMIFRSYSSPGRPEAAVQFLYGYILRSSCTQLTVCWASYSSWQHRLKEKLTLTHFGLNFDKLSLKISSKSLSPFLSKFEAKLEEPWVYGVHNTSL